MYLIYGRYDSWSGNINFRKGVWPVRASKTFLTEECGIFGIVGGVNIVAISTFGIKASLVFEQSFVNKYR